MKKEFILRNMSTGRTEFLSEDESVALRTLEIYAQHCPNAEFWLYERVATAKAEIPVVVKHLKESAEAETEKTTLVEHGGAA